MPEKWTGELVGRMHNEGITFKDLADEIGVKRPYVSMLLNSKRKPNGARERLEAAVDEIIKRKKAERAAGREA